MTTPGFKDAAGSVRLTSQGPPQTGRDRPVVILALEWETLSAAVEAEHFIIQIQPRHDRLQSVSSRNPIAHFRVHLRVRVKISVATWVFCVAAAIGPNVGIIVAESHARRDALLVIRQIEVPIVRSSADQSWVVRPAKIRRETGL